MADTSAAAPGRRVDVAEVIDSAKFFPVPFGIAVMMIIIMLTDGFDLGTMGRVGTHLLTDWGISPTELGPINTAGLIGMAIGSVGLGWAGDRIGRKKAYISCLALLFVGSILCYVAQDVWQLTLFRGLTGLGLGGVTPLATTLMAEWSSKRVRSVAVASVIVAVPLGAALAGIVERMIVPEYGWRSMFFVGAVAPLILFAVFGFILPESPKYMAQRPSMHKRLARSLNLLLGRKEFDGTEFFFVPAESRTERADAAQGQRSGFLQRFWLANLFNREFWLITVLIWLAFAVNSFVLYAFTNYLQPLLAFGGQTGNTASLAADLFFYGAFFGSIGGAFLIGWFGSRWVGAGLAFLGVTATAVLALVLSPNLATGLLLVLCLLAGMSVNGMQAFMYAVTANAYPTSFRGAAVGMAQTFSRLGAVLSPMAATAYFAMAETEGTPVSAFLWFIAACAMITTISFFLIPRHIAPGAKKAPVATARPPQPGAGA